MIFFNLSMPIFFPLITRTTFLFLNRSFSFIKDKTTVLPYLLAKENNLLALTEEEGRVLIAISDPIATDCLKEAELFLNKEIEVLYCGKELLNSAIERVYQQKERRVQPKMGRFQKERKS